MNTEQINRTLEEEFRARNSGNGRFFMPEQIFCRAYFTISPQEKPVKLDTGICGLVQIVDGSKSNRKTNNQCNLLVIQQQYAPITDRFVGTDFDIERYSSNWHKQLGAAECVLAIWPGKELRTHGNLLVRTDKNQVTDVAANFTTKQLCGKGCEDDINALPGMPIHYAIPAVVEIYLKCVNGHK
ncbi:MAG: hypothetical protein V1837_06240 [Candidatus Woesearchaeota archaeon]